MVHPRFWFVTVWLLLLVGVVDAADWPQYRGPHGDGHTDEIVGHLSWPEDGPPLVWKVDTPLGFSSFSVADGRAVTLATRELPDGRRHESCLALDATTGEQLWFMDFGVSDYENGGGDSGAPGNRGGDGPRSTPTLDGDHVYVYDAHLMLTCIDAGSGRVQWQQDVARNHGGENIRWKNAVSPVVVDQLVCIPGGGSGRAFLAFDKRSGELVWHGGNEVMTHATPTLATIHGERHLIFFMHSGLVGVVPSSGEELWHSPFPFRVSSAASPVVDRDFVYCSAGYGIGAGVLRIVNSNRAYDAEDVWQVTNKLMNHWSTPVACDGYLYGIFGVKRYGRAPLQCVELETGEVQWSHEGFGPGNCILVGDHLLVLSDDGRLVLAEANPAAYVELAQTQAIAGKCWSMPAFSDGRVFVRSTQQGACFDLSQVGAAGSK